jgi:hypothetical protein
MAIVTTKSASITGLDASPPFWSPIGEGGAGPKQTLSDFVTATSGDSIGSIYRFCRVPTNAKIKRVRLSSLVTGAGAGDIGLAYSDSLTDGTNPALAGIASGIIQISAADNKIFGSAVALTTPIRLQDQTLANLFTIQNMNQPLWQALINLGVTQFSADPGGKFDLYIKLTTGISVATGTIGIECDYAM